MKTCATCRVSKPVSEFGSYARSKDGLQGRCRECKRKYDNAYYANNEQRKIGIRTKNVENQRGNLEFLWNYYLQHPCVDCGESDPIVLQMDHLRDKVANVSAMMRGSRAALEAEIAKCEVRCANCHSRKTATEYGWYSALLV